MMDLTGELLEVSTLQKGKSEKATRDTEIALKVTELRKKAADEEVKRNESMFNEMKDSIKNAEELFERTAREQPSAWDLVGLNIVESLGNMLPAIIDAGVFVASRGTVNPQTSQSQRQDTTISQDSAIENEHRTIVIDNGYIMSDLILQAVTMIKTLCTVDENGKPDWTKIRDVSKGAQYTTALINDICKRVTEKYEKSITPAAREAIDICTTGAKVGVVEKRLWNPTPRDG